MVFKTNLQLKIFVKRKSTFIYWTYIESSLHIKKNS